MKIRRLLFPVALGLAFILGPGCVTQYYRDQVGTVARERSLKTARTSGQGLDLDHLNLSNAVTNGGSNSCGTSCVTRVLNTLSKLNNPHLREDPYEVSTVDKGYRELNLFTSPAAIVDRLEREGYYTQMINKADFDQDILANLDKGHLIIALIGKPKGESPHYVLLHGTAGEGAPNTGRQVRLVDAHKGDGEAFSREALAEKGFGKVSWINLPSDFERFVIVVSNRNNLGPHRPPVSNAPVTWVGNLINSSGIIARQFSAPDLLGLVIISTASASMMKRLRNIMRAKMPLPKNIKAKQPLNKAG